MKKFDKSVLFGLISLIAFAGSVRSQDQDDFYDHSMGFYLDLISVHNTSKGYDNPIFWEQPDLLIDCPPNYSIFSGNVHMEFVSTEQWGYHGSLKSNFLSDAWYLLTPSDEGPEPVQANSSDKVSMNFFCSLLQSDNGINVFVSDRFRLAAGGSFNIQIITTYNQDGSQYVKNGGHFMIGPYINGDVVLLPWLLFRTEVISNFTFFHSGNVADKSIRDQVKNPYLVSVFPYFITKFGLMLGAEFSFFNRMLDADYTGTYNYDDVLTGEKFHTTRMDLKLGFLF